MYDPTEHDGLFALLVSVPSSVCICRDSEDTWSFSAK